MQSLRSHVALMYLISRSLQTGGCIGFCVVLHIISTENCFHAEVRVNKKLQSNVLLKGPKRASSEGSSTLRFNCAETFGYAEVQNAPRFNYTAVQLH